LGNRAGALSWWFNANHLDSRGQPMSFLTQPLSTKAAAAGDRQVSGARTDLDPSGAARTILGATGIAHTIQDQAKLKLAYDISPTLVASYTLGLWQGDNTTGVASYLKDAAGNPVYSGKVNFGGKQYTLKDTDLNPGTSEQQHWMHGLALASRSGGTWDWEALASLYDYSRDLSRSPTVALPTAAGGGPGSLTDMRGTGWRTLDLRGTWRPNAAHEANFGYHFDHYQLKTLVSTTANWTSGAAQKRTSAFAGKTETQALYAQDAWRFAKDWKATVGGRWENWQAFDGAVAQSGAELLAAVTLVGAVQLEVLVEHLRLRVRFKLVRHAGRHVDYRTHRIARIQRRKRSVHYIDALDFLRRDHAPARRITVTVAQQIRQQQIVRIHQRPGADQRAGRARGDDAVGIADEALAYLQRRQILERVFGIDHVDAVGHLFAGNGFDYRRHFFRRARSGAALHHYFLQLGIGSGLLRAIGRLRCRHEGASGTNGKHCSQPGFQREIHGCDSSHSNKSKKGKRQDASRKVTGTTTLAATVASPRRAGTKRHC
jgi:hypothetical protein